jgi:tetratricopeptide (TPR) repeat protein
MGIRTVILAPFVAALLSGADAGVDRALDLYNHTNYKAAVAALKQKTQDAQTLQLLGQCYFMQGDFKDATDALERAAALDSGSSMIQTWLGRAYGGRAQTAFALGAIGHVTKTRTAFEKAVHLDPGNADALNDLFDFYMQAPGVMGGGMDKAQKLLPQIAKHDPVGAHLAQSRIDEEKKKFDKAEAELRLTLRLGPDKVGLYLNLAMYLARHGRYEESEGVFRQAEKMAPDSPRTLYARADAYISAQRNQGEARDLLKKYLDSQNLTPDDPPRWEALKLLKKVEGS